MNFHFIAIGGKVMHQLALELHSQGHLITGSDDEIYDPARSNLAEMNLLPDPIAWDISRIHPRLDAVILGMHAHQDNPELAEARRLGIPVFSFPEFYGQYTSNKKKIVVCGSHGKTTTTAMIIHALHEFGLETDYLLGGELPGLKRMVRIREDSEIAVIEGDEYLSSRQDPRPKMLLYQGDIIVLTGVAWDHMNVFPSFEIYVDQFRQLIASIPGHGKLIYYKPDKNIQSLVREFPQLTSLPYEALAGEGETVEFEGKHYPLMIFGNHNLANLHAAMLACSELGIEKSAFLKAMAQFRGAGNRLQLLSEDPVIYLDYAHAPSKLRATIEAVRNRYPQKRILAVYELHTYSSLNVNFLSQYAGAMDLADQGLVFYEQHALQMKRLPPLAIENVREGFASDQLIISNDVGELSKILSGLFGQYEVFLFMSSGNFGGLDIRALSEVNSAAKE